MSELPRCRLCNNTSLIRMNTSHSCSYPDCPAYEFDLTDWEWCKLMGEPDIERENAEPSTDLYELARAVKTVNRSARHRILVAGDDEPCYWQRKEWVEWIVSLADKALGVNQ